MSHFAELDADNKVLRVLVGDNNYSDEGYQWFIDNLGGNWIQTSYNNRIRFNFASIGYTYDSTRDAFIAPKCHDEAVLDEINCRWSCANAAHDLLT